MNVEIIYSNENAMMLSYVAESIASDISKKLQPLSAKIDKANATVLFYFGSKDFKIEINAPPLLEREIEKLLAKADGEKTSVITS